MRWLVYIAFFTSFQVCAQSNLKPFLKLAFYQSYLDDLMLKELELGAGIQFNDYLSAGLYLRGAQRTQREFHPPSRYFQIVTISIEPMYRILSKKYMLSPVIAYNAGMEVANNTKDRIMNRYFYSSYYDYGYRIYDKGLYFGKAKLLLSFQWKGLDVLFGATYSTYFFRFKNLTPDYPTLDDPTLENKYFIEGTRVDKQFGFGFEASLKYSIPMRKKQAE